MAFIAGAGATNVDLLYENMPKIPDVGEEIYTDRFSCQLGGSRRLTGALESWHHDDCHGAPRLELDLRRLGTHEFDPVFVDDLDHHLPRVQTVHHVLTDRALLHVSDEALYHLKVDVRLEKSHLDFPEGNLHVVFGKSSFAAQVFEHILKFFC